MNEADALASGKHENKKSLSALSREVVQTAEDAREIAVKHIDEERAESERTAGAGREAHAKAHANEETERRLNAEAATAEAVRDRNVADRNNRDAQAAAQQSAGCPSQRRKRLQRRPEKATSRRNRFRPESRRRGQFQRTAQRRRAGPRRASRPSPPAFNLILETRDTARGLVVNMSDVLFDSGKYTLRPLAREKLAKISGIVLGYPSLKLAVEGNTDSVGTELFNQDLSEKRTEGIRTYLTQQGVPESSTTATGFGKIRPIASNDTSEGRQQNRCVELIV